jgi:hypothetical protein
LVSGLEADAVNVLGQPVRVAPDLLDRVFAVSLEDPRCPACADSVAVEENHDVADDLLFRPRRLDLLPSLGADAVHVFQPGRFRLDDVENLLPEIIHQLLGVDRGDGFDHPVAQVFFDALFGGRRTAGKHFRPEPEAKLAVLHPAALGREPFSRADGRQGADHGHQVAVSLNFDLQNDPKCSANPVARALYQVPANARPLRP